MAIEYGGGMAGQSPGDGSMHETVEDESQEGQTTEVPLDMIREGKPGDVVRLEIVSRNDDSGTATVKYAEEPKMGSSIKEAAAKFEE